MGVETLILKMRLQTLKKNLMQVKGVLSSVAGQQVNLQTLQDQLAKIFSNASSLKNMIDSSKGELEESVETLNFNLPVSTLDLDKIPEVLENIRDDLKKIPNKLQSANDVVKNIQNNLLSAKQIVNSMRICSVQIQGTEPERTLREVLGEETQQCISTLDYIGDSLVKKGNEFVEAAKLENAWKDYSTNVYLKSVPIFTEYVDFLGGLALRERGFDEGVCQIADELISKLEIHNIRHSLTIPALHETVSVALARIIRMGFPEWTIWALPLTAHEFGYVVVNKNKKLDQFVSDFVKNAPDERAARYHMQHCLADAFATYSMGPAYACAAILLRFDPSEAYTDKYENPADAKRAYVVLGMLEWMNKKVGEPKSPYTAIIKTLREAWDTALQQAKPTGKAPTDDEKKQLNKWIDNMGDFLAITSVAYLDTGWEKSTSVDWQNNFSPNKVNDIKLGGEEELRDVLNAAWWCRVQQLANIEEVTKNENIIEVDNIAKAAFELRKRIDKVRMDKQVEQRTKRLIVPTGPTL